MMEEKLEVNMRENIEEKVEEKTEVKFEERVEEKTEGKTEEEVEVKTGEKPEEKAEEKVEEKLEAKTEVKTKEKTKKKTKRKPKRKLEIDTESLAHRNSPSDTIVEATGVVGMRLTELAAGLGITRPALGNKLRRGSFTVSDLIKVASVMGLQLAFIKRKKIIATFDAEKIIERRPSGFAVAPLSGDLLANAVERCRELGKRPKKKKQKAEPVVEAGAAKVGEVAEVVEVSLKEVAEAIEAKNENPVETISAKVEEDAQSLDLAAKPS